jgi:hypothetical protein
MYRIRKIDEKFDSLDEFIDNIERGGEIEFAYNNKNYSITHSGGKLCFVEQYNAQSAVDFNIIQELLEYTIDGKKIKDIVTIIQPFFRCF